MEQGIEWQVSNKELSQKLKELGVKQESLFYHGKKYTGEWAMNIYTERVNERLYSEWFSAFTVAELGEMLPYSLDVSYPTGYLNTVKIDKEGWRCCYVNGAGVIAKDGFRFQFTADTEADARAKMLIYLLENKLI